jgi:hypothetical protein
MTIKIFKYWLLLALVICGMSLLMYTTSQQVLRQGANDPQIQIAEDNAAQLAQGAQATTLVGSQTVDMGSSLATWVMVFDDNGQVLSSTARLNGQIPTMPGGFLQQARSSGEYRVTWQPQEGVRSALVVTRFQGTAESGFVVVGRSLREAEIRENNVLLIDVLGCAGILGVSFLATMVLFWRPRRILGRDVPQPKNAIHE